MIGKYSQKGFTVVELLVIVVVVTILAMMSYFVISSWRKDSATTQVKNELTQAVNELKQVRNFNSSYPATAAFSSVYKVGEDVTLTYTRRSNDTFCLNAVSQTESDVVWNVDSNVSMAPREGTC